MSTNWKTRGATVAEVMIIFSIVGIFLAIVASRGCTSGGETKEAATRDAKKYVAELGWDVSGIACADVDSDGDGYVSCTIAKKNGTNEFVECRAAYAFGHGCRIPKLRLDRDAR